MATGSAASDPSGFSSMRTGTFMLSTPSAPTGGDQQLWILARRASSSFWVILATGPVCRSEPSEASRFDALAPPPEGSTLLSSADMSFRSKSFSDFFSGRSDCLSGVGFFGVFLSGFGVSGASSAEATSTGFGGFGFDVGLTAGAGAGFTSAVFSGAGLASSAGFSGSALISPVSAVGFGAAAGFSGAGVGAGGVGAGGSGVGSGSGSGGVGSGGLGSGGFSAFGGGVAGVGGGAEASGAAAVSVAFSVMGVSWSVGALPARCESGRGAGVSTLAWLAVSRSGAVFVPSEIWLISEIGTRSTGRASTCSTSNGFALGSWNSPQAISRR